jgi:hypothetical protein
MSSPSPRIPRGATLTDAETSRSLATRSTGDTRTTTSSSAWRVDPLGCTLRVPASAEPVSAVRSYLPAGRTYTANELSKKTVVVIDPGARFGQFVWPAP